MDSSSADLSLIFIKKWHSTVQESRKFFKTAKEFDKLVSYTKCPASSIVTNSQFGISSASSCSLFCGIWLKPPPIIRVGMIMSVSRAYHSGLGLLSCCRIELKYMLYIYNRLPQKMFNFLYSDNGIRYKLYPLTKWLIVSVQI